MIFSLSLIALTVAAWLVALVRFTQPDGRHCGAWKPLRRRSKPADTRVVVRFGSQPEAVA